MVHSRNWPNTVYLVRTVVSTGKELADIDSIKLFLHALE